MEPSFLSFSSAHRGNNGELTASPHLYRNRQSEESDGGRQFSVLQSSDKTSVTNASEVVHPEHFLLALLDQKSDDSSQERVFSAVCGMFEQLQQALVTTAQENAELRERIAQLEAAQKIKDKIHQEESSQMHAFFADQEELDKAAVIEESFKRKFARFTTFNGYTCDNACLEDTRQIWDDAQIEFGRIEENAERTSCTINQHAKVIGQLSARIRGLEKLLSQQEIGNK